MESVLTIQSIPQKVRISLGGGNSIEADLHIDGDQFCVLVGQDLQSGCAAFGRTIDEAVENFQNAAFNHGVKGFGK